MDIILASSSAYRRRLLERLQIPFRCLAPKTDESHLPGESPSALSQRLAIAKARAITDLHPDALVIGSDQVASIGGDILGKPGGFVPAVEQLLRCSGREVRFFTAVAVVSQGLERFHVEPFSVFFRQLSEEEITNYLLREEPYDCAGSFKVECLGIALFERLRGNDPTSLEGLPLIALIDLLRDAGVDVFSK